MLAQTYRADRGDGTLRPGIAAQSLNSPHQTQLMAMSAQLQADPRRQALSGLAARLTGSLPGTQAGPVQLVAKKNYKKRVTVKKAKAFDLDRKPVRHRDTQVVPAGAARRSPRNHKMTDALIGQIRKVAFRLQRDPDLIYGPNPSHFTGAALLGRRNRGAMTDDHTRMILTRARDARTVAATGGQAPAVTSQESLALTMGDGFTKLSDVQGSRNHKVADSAIYALFSDVVRKGRAALNPGDADPALSDEAQTRIRTLMASLHGNDGQTQTVLDLLTAALAEKGNAGIANRLNDATFIASHGANNLRIGDKEQNTRIMNSFDPNFKSTVEYVPDGDLNSGQDATTLTADEVRQRQEEWQQAKGADEEARPKLRRRGTLRSETIREAIRQMGLSGVVDEKLALASITGVYDRATGEQVSSSAELAGHGLPPAPVQNADADADDGDSGMDIVQDAAKDVLVDA